MVPDIERIVGAAEQRLRDEMQTGFDALTERLDKLEGEYHMLVVSLKRVEERLDRVEQRLGQVEQRLDKVEQRLDKVEQGLGKLVLRSELVDLKTRVDGLQEQIRTLEARLES